MTAALQRTIHTERGSRAETFSEAAPPAPPTKRRAVVSIMLSAALIAALALTVHAVDATASGFSAAVYPSVSLQLSFPGTGPIQQVFVHAGESVSKGQRLALQDVSAFEPALQLALASAAADQRKVAALQALEHATASSSLPSATRTLRLAQINAEIVTAEAALVTEGALAAADRRRIAGATLRAPQAGIVEAVQGVPGEVAGPSGVLLKGSALAAPAQRGLSFRPTPPVKVPLPTSRSSTGVVTLMVGHSWQVDALVPQSSVSGLRPGARATFTFSAFGGVSVPCTVTGLSGARSDVAGNVFYQVVLTPRGALPRGVLPGMSGTLAAR